MDYNTPIDSAGFSVRTFNAIKRAFPGVNTLGELRQAMANEEATRNLGRNSLSEINEALAAISNTETVETDMPTDLPDTPTDTAAFDYSAVDEDTANYLRKATARIANSYADIGAVLAEAQERLAHNNNGIFEKWYTSIGMKRDTVYNFIRIHNFRNEMLNSSEFRRNQLDIFDNLPKTLQADISSPSAPAEAVNAVLSGDITTHKDYIALKKRIEELTEELDKADDWNEELTEERDKLKKDLERSESDARIVSTNYDKLREDYEELDDKNTALELELKKARSQPQDAAIIPDPTESEEYKSILDERNKMHRQIIETTRENDRLKDKQKELLDRYNELYERAKAAADSSARELTGYFLPVSVEEYSDICKQLKGTKYAELLYKAKLIKF